ncbi:MAG: hypothetical protein QG670_2172 [Thermoproteota archaeon]|nr:hypothetical protein [Thermoproteota archaeon]
MTSYIKIYGPPLFEAIGTLEKIAVDMPEVCIMDLMIENSPPMSEMEVQEYFRVRAPFVTEIPVERCSKIISKSGVKLGEYDFYFEWPKQPSRAELNQLIQKIDKAFTPLGCKYTITTKEE